MSKTKKTALFILMILLLGTVSAGSIFIYLNEKGTGGSNYNGNKFADQHKGNAVHEEGNTRNPFGEPFLSPINEGVMQQYIHAMSHQKVEADKKWSFYEMTEERIDYLLAELDKDNYKHEDVYREILLKWKDGNFTEANHDHNEVWALQNGSVGRAEGLLSSEEEQAYLKKQKTEKR